jgi:hypothetical protein
VQISDNLHSDGEAENSAESINTVRETIESGEDVRVTLETEREFVATPDALQEYRDLAEEVSRPRTNPPHGMIRAIFGVKPDDLPSKREEQPGSIIVECFEDSSGGWGDVKASWLVQDGTCVGGPEETIETHEMIVSLEVVTDE